MNLYEVMHLLPLPGCVTGLTVVDGAVTPSEGRTTPEGSEVGWVISIPVVGVTRVMDKHKAVHSTVESEHRGKKWILKPYFKKREGLL